jgi:pSer/pThr/pTyr-binding forkhead associated (FHA) protein
MRADFNPRCERGYQAMKTKLKVMTGKSAGKELPITVDQFLIGRDADCQLRPGSDAIAGKHCRLARREGAFWVADLGSPNGTLVNGKRIAGEVKLNSGDRLQVGPLEFEVFVEYEIGGQRAEKVRDVSDVAARVVKKADKDHDIDSWLTADEEEEAQPRSQRFDVGEINAALEAEKAAEEAAEAAKKKKKIYGKLPKKDEDVKGKDTRDAANEMLRRMFHKK